MSPGDTIESLLEDSKTSGTSFRESKVTISVRPERDEQFIFFHIDNPDTNPKIRQIIQSDRGIGIVDLIIRYQKMPKISILLIYADGKGRDINHGVTQIIDTHTRLTDYCNSNNISLIDRYFSAIIVQRNSTSSVPAATISELKKNIQKMAGISTTMVKVVKVYGNGDQISEVVRGMYQKIC
ncbi:MAG: hypothetical protein V1862_09775 [Methanobacteriota archaeon]